MKKLFTLLALLTLSTPSFGDLQVGQRVRVQSVAANYTATNFDDAILADASLAQRAVTLPSASVLANKGKVMTIKKTDSSVNSVLVTAIGGQTIDRLTTQNLVFQDSFITIASNGSNWIILNSSAHARVMGTIKWSGCSAEFNSPMTSTTFGPLTTSPPTGCVTTVTGSAKAPTGTVRPAFSFASLSAGEYKIEVQGKIIIRQVNAVDQGDFQFTDGTTTAREISSFTKFGQAGPSGFSQSFSYSNAVSSPTWEIYSRGVSTSDQQYITASNTVPLVITLWYFPSAGSQ